MTGCNVNYNVTINEDLSVLENVNIKETDEFYNIRYRNTKVNALEDVLELHLDQLKEHNYQYKLVDNDNNPYILLNKKYQNIDNYLNNSLLFNDFFDEIKYQKKDNIIKIETEGFNRCEEDNPERFYVDKLTIGIKCPYKVINNNAIRVDEKRNIYYYEIDSTTEDFKILLEFDVTKKHNPYIKEIIMIIVLTIISIGMWIFVIINKKKKN